MRTTFYFVLLLSSTLFYPLRTTFYSVLLYSTPRTFPSATPFYHSLTTFFTSCYTALPLANHVLLRATPFYSLRTRFTPRTFIYFWLLAGPFSHSDLLLSCVRSAVIQCLFYSRYVSVLHPFSFAFLCKFSLSELVEFAELAFLIAVSCLRNGLSGIFFPSFPAFSSPFRPVFSLFSSLYAPFFRLFRHCGRLDFCPLSQLCKLTNSP